MTDSGPRAVPGSQHVRMLQLSRITPRVAEMLPVCPPASEIPACGRFRGCCEPGRFAVRPPADREPSAARGTFDNRGALNPFQHLCAFAAAANRDGSRSAVFGRDVLNGAEDFLLRWAHHEASALPCEHPCRP